MDQLPDVLEPLINLGVGISNERPPRWSTFGAPHPNIVVDVATEAGVAAVVSFSMATPVNTFGLLN
jgi:hypothetical protein